MREELKIRIRNSPEVDKGLLQKGAKFSHEFHVVDTYFQQPKGEVLKITEDETGNFLVNLKARDGKFEIVKYQKLDNVGEEKSKLQRQFGVKAILKKKRRFFDFQQYIINVNIIKDVGEFLIVEGERVSPAIFHELGIENPKFITVSFDELKDQAPKKPKIPRERDSAVDDHAPYGTWREE